MAKPINLAVLISGSGRTLQNFIDLHDAGKLDARVSVVISSRKDAYGLERAREHNIAAVCIPSREYKNFEIMSTVIATELEEHEVDLIAMAGFMCLFKIPKAFHGRIMNIHPALIPAFCGKGLYGHFVHEAIIKRGCKLTGVTVHFADDVYDRGPIILQLPVPVLDDDTPDTLAARTFEKECEAYPWAIQLYAENRLIIQGNRVRILPAGNGGELKTEN